MAGTRTVTYNTKYPLDYQQEFVDHLDKEIKERVQACQRVNADWRQIHKLLTSVKETYLEANELEQCYSCGAIFEKSYLHPTKFCSEHCKQSENLEVI